MLCETGTWGNAMNKARLQAAIEKLALAGAKAGFTTEQMIELLDAGIGVEASLDVIAWRLEQPTPLGRVRGFSEWIA